MKVTRFLFFTFLLCWGFQPKAISKEKRPFGFQPIYIEGSPLSKFDEDNTLEVIFPAKMIGPDKSGYNFEAELPPGTIKTISYEVKFSPDFDFVKGGKLPGLCGGNVASGGERANGKGFSARVMWKEDGRVISYVYHMNQKENYGDVFVWVDPFSVPLYFLKDTWQKVKMVVKLNDVGKSNGMIQGYLNKELVFEEKDFMFRNNERIQVDKLCFNTFFGGDNKTWAPQKKMKLWIKNLEVE